MPEMDGFETAKILNQQDKTRVNTEDNRVNFVRYSLIDLEDILLSKDSTQMKSIVVNARKKAEEDNYAKSQER